MSGNVFTINTVADFMRSVDKTFEKSETLRAASEAEMNRRIAESHRDYEAKIAESRRETDARIAAAEARLDASLKLFVNEGNKRIKSLSRDIGGVSHKLGGLTEFLVIPSIKKEMEKVGHKFTRSYADKEFKGFVRGFRQLIAEVDLFLSNGDEAMAVEIKTTLKVEYVNAHLDRLKKLRDYEEDTNLKGKKLYGAVVGIFIEPHARKLALKNGLYVIEVLEYEKMLKTEKPERRKAW